MVAIQEKEPQPVEENLFDVAQAQFSQAALEQRYTKSTYIEVQGKTERIVCLRAFYQPDGEGGANWVIAGGLRVWVSRFVQTPELMVVGVEEPPLAGEDGTVLLDKRVVFYNVFRDGETYRNNLPLFGLDFDVHNFTKLEAPERQAVADTLQHGQLAPVEFGRE